MLAIKQKICTVATHNADIKLRPDLNRYNFTMAWTRLVADSIAEIISLNNLRHSIHTPVSDTRNEYVLPVSLFPPRYVTMNKVSSEFRSRSKGSLIATELQD